MSPIYPQRFQWINQRIFIFLGKRSARKYGEWACHNVFYYLNFFEWPLHSHDENKKDSCQWFFPAGAHRRSRDSSNSFKNSEQRCSSAPLCSCRKFQIPDTSACAFRRTICESGRSRPNRYLLIFFFSDEQVCITESGERISPREFHLLDAWTGAFRKDDNRSGIARSSARIIVSSFVPNLPKNAFIDRGESRYRREGRFVNPLDRFTQAPQRGYGNRMRPGNRQAQGFRYKSKIHVNHLNCY